MSSVLAVCQQENASVVNLRMCLALQKCVFLVVYQMSTQKIVSASGVQEDVNSAVTLVPAPCARVDSKYQQEAVCKGVCPKHIQIQLIV